MSKFKDGLTSICTESKALWNKSEKKAVIGIMFMTMVIALYFYFGIQDFFVKMFPNTNHIGYYKYLYHNFAPALFFFVPSVILVKFVFKQPLKEYGFTLGDYKLGLKICAIGIPLLVLSGLFVSLTDTDMNTLYPLARDVIGGSFGVIALYYLSYIVYYISWEFLFRGVGYFSTEKLGVFVAVAITTMISALIHSSIAGFGKPFSETFSAIFAGVIFGLIAYKTRSMLYPLILHMTVGFSTDFFISIFTNSGII